MKLLYICLDNTSLCNAHAIALIKLMSQEAEIMVCANEDDRDILHELSASMIRRDIVSVNLAQNLDRNLVSSLRIIIDKFDPDVVHAIGESSSFYAGLAMAFRPKPYLISTLASTQTKRYGNLWRRFLEALAFSRVKKFLVFTEYEAELLKKTLKNSKITSVPYLQELPKFIERHEARSRLGFEDEVFIIGCIVDGYNQDKQDNLVEAIKILADQKMPIILLLLSDYPLDHLLDLGGQYNLRQHFSVMQTGNPILFAKAFDLFASSDHFPSLDLLTAAIQACLPIVALQNPYTEEIIPSLEKDLSSAIGSLVKVDNSIQFASQLKTLIENTELRKSMADQELNMQTRGVDNAAERYRFIYWQGA